MAVVRIYGTGAGRCRARNLLACRCGLLSGCVLRLVGHSDVGGGGFNADVCAHDGFAYLGVWGADAQHCPASGVKVVDVRHPSHPRLVARLANPAGTTAEDVVVRSVRTRAFRGDLAVTGIQRCAAGTGVFRGLSFWDVTHPARPRELGRWAPPGDQRGCHEVDLVQRPDGRVLAGCALIFAELPSGPGGPAPVPEVRLIDVTNPRAPVQAGDWTLGRDLGLDPTQGVGCFPLAFAHSVRFFDRGRTVYVSYWDAGTIHLDIHNPAAPRFVGRAVITPPDEDGDNHSMTLAKGGRTEVVRGDQAFSSWYSDGIVWWTVDNHGVTRQVAQFVPPAAPDPQGEFPTIPIVWGVYPDRDSDLILASDINSGLWILEPIGLGGF